MVHRIWTSAVQLSFSKALDQHPLTSPDLSLQTHQTGSLLADNVNRSPPLLSEAGNWFNPQKAMQGLAKFERKKTGSMDCERKPLGVVKERISSSLWEQNIFPRHTEPDV